MTDSRRPWRLVQNKLVRYLGGREIDRFRGISPAVDDRRPEAWVGSTTRNRWAESPTEGYAEALRPSGGRCFLIDAIQENPEDMLGGPADLSLLMKLLDAGQDLDLQCHPTREVAKRLFDSDYGKAEAWIVVGLRDDSPEPPFVRLGFQEDVTKEQFLALYRARDKQALNELTHKIPVATGDVFIVAPGVPHLVGMGCFLVEAQEPSDITVGAIQYPRWTEAQRAEREIHVAECFEFKGLSLEDTVKAYKVVPRTVRAGAWGREELLIGPAQTPYFSCTRLTATGPAPLRRTGRAAVGIVLEGSGALVQDGETLALKKADEFFLPAAAEGVVLEPGADGIHLVLGFPEGAVHAIEAS
jgi:mannose-6-phosphate isomerase